jgi:hypothetical protein
MSVFQPGPSPIGSLPEMQGAPKPFLRQVEMVATAMDSLQEIFGADQTEVPEMDTFRGYGQVYGLTRVLCERALDGSLEIEDDVSMQDIFARDYNVNTVGQSTGAFVDFVADHVLESSVPISAEIFDESSMPTSFEHPIFMLSADGMVVIMPTVDGKNSLILGTIDGLETTTSTEELMKNENLKGCRGIIFKPVLDKRNVEVDVLTSRGHVPVKVVVIKE